MAKMFSKRASLLVFQLKSCLTISFQILTVFPLTFLSCRRAPVEPIEYPVQPWAGHRDPMHYPNPQSGYHLSYPPRDNYPHPVDPRQNDSGFYHPPPQQRGPLRQDVPPSPTIPLRGPRFDTMNRGGYRNSSPERYAYGEARHSDPRQKSPMTAAV